MRLHLRKNQEDIQEYLENQIIPDNLPSSRDASLEVCNLTLDLECFYIVFNVVTAAIAIGFISLHAVYTIYYSRVSRQCFRISGGKCNLSTLQKLSSDKTAALQGRAMIVLLIQVRFCSMGNKGTRFLRRCVKWSSNEDVFRHLIRFH